MIASLLIHSKTAFFLLPFYFMLVYILTNVVIYTSESDVQ